VVCLVATLLQICHRMQQWKNFENRSIIGKDMDKTLWLTFLGHPVNATMEKSTLKYRDGKSTFPIFTLHIFFCHFKTKEIIFFAVHCIWGDDFDNLVEICITGVASCVESDVLKCWVSLIRQQLTQFECPYVTQSAIVMNKIILMTHNSCTHEN